MTAIDDAKVIITAQIATGAPGSITAPKLQSILLQLADACADIDHVHDTRYYLKAEIEPLTAKGQANGYAPLDSEARIPLANMPESFAGGLTYQGGWNASTNDPELLSSTGTTGHYYIVTTAGATTLDGISTWNIGDEVVFNGSTWERVAYTATVVSVAGKSGVVTLDSGDVGLDGILTNGSDIASASTINLTTATGDYVVVTGTTAITAITLAEGLERKTRFADQLTLTHGASLILPRAQNRVTAAGDVATWRGEAGGVVRLIDYHVADDRVLKDGYAATPYNAGSKTSGTFTPDARYGNLQYATNGGAHALAPPTNSGSMVLLYANNASAGVINTTGFTMVTGDNFTTTNGHEFMCYITKHNNGADFSHLHITALQ